MTIPDGVGETLRKAMTVPSDTMITLDLPLLLTRLSQIPADRALGSDVDVPPSDMPATPAEPRTHR